MRKPTMCFPTRSDINQTMARGCKFWIKKVEELYCTCSENKGTDQLRSYREADIMHLCFCKCETFVFSWCGSNSDILA